MAAPYNQVVLLGDSLMERTVEYADGFSFFGALQLRCIRRLDVVNRGFSGWNSRDTVKYLPEIFPAPSTTSAKIDYLIILLGANDACLPLSSVSQHVPPEQYKKNLHDIVNHPHIQAHKPKILMVTPPPVDQMKLTKTDLAAGHPSVRRTSAVSSGYSEKAREVARENPGVILVDLWQAIMDAAIALTPVDYKVGGPWLGSPENGKPGGLDKLLPDGLHMGADAYRVFWKALEPHIGQEWTCLPEDDRRTYVFPDWKGFNGGN